jgi:two-component system phosphate regulon sensor histidine kinase PhoR
MYWRIVSFVACQLAGALVGWFGASPTGVVTTELEGLVLGVVLGGVAWFLIDLSRGARWLKWLRNGDFSEVAMGTGLWGEVSARVRRLVLDRDRLLRESQNRLQDFLMAFQASPNGVMLLDSRGAIEWFNQTAAMHFGLDAQRDMLQHIGNLVREPGFVRYFSAQDYRDELVMPGRENTSVRPVRISVHLYPYGQGRLLLLSRDITALEQAEAMRRDFVANVSHEIRTPLTVLSGFVETLQSCTFSEPERERYLALMAQQADRMQTLVSDLLTLSRLEGSPPPGTADWIDMPAMMSRLEQEGQALSAALNPMVGPLHSLVFDCQLQCELAGAGNELFSAMSNLLSNAIRYTPAGGEIAVRWSGLPDGRAEFSVADSGPGIAPEHLPRLTERFYRVDHSRSRDTGGTGLGLAIVKHVAQRHDAELKIQSTLGKGSVFSIVFAASRVKAAQLTIPG